MSSKGSGRPVSPKTLLPAAPQTAMGARPTTHEAGHSPRVRVGQVQGTLLSLSGLRPSRGPPDPVLWLPGARRGRGQARAPAREPTSWGGVPGAPAQSQLTAGGGGVASLSSAGPLAWLRPQAWAASAREAWGPPGAQRVWAWLPPLRGPLQPSLRTWACWLARVEARAWVAPGGTDGRT